MCVPELRQEMGCLVGAASQDNILNSAYLYSSRILCDPAEVATSHNDFVS